MRIRFLSPEDAQKVAAGEVIERPANGIKELLENSIDAKATHIELEVHEGGKTKIRITDNGIGMSSDDAHICFERYATSKLGSFNDLTHVQTHGFRGEALASICSVAKVTLTTKEQGHIEGLQLKIEEGKVLSSHTVSSQVGTTLLIEDLFYNIPARKKFLKNTATEWNQILALFKAFCLAYPHVHFELFHNDEQIYNCPTVPSVTQRIAQLFDARVTTSLCELITVQTNELSVSGVVTTSDYNRYDRSGIYFFVNNRLVKNYQLGRALLKGFENLLPPGKYPLAVITLTIDPLYVDVNIHPKKEEVLFLHPHKVEQAICQAVKLTLEKQTEQQLSKSIHRPHNPFGGPTIYNTQQPPFPFAKPLYQPLQTYNGYTPDPFTQEPVTPSSKLDSADPVHVEQQDTVQVNQTYFEEPTYHIIGQHQTTYILLEHPEGLLLVDQHAAHERILYERFKNNFKNPETVHLLFPVIINLSVSDCDLLLRYVDLLKQHGISVEQFGSEQLRITSVPVYAKHLPLAELMQELLSWINEHDAQSDDTFLKKITEKIHAQLACKAAIKAGDVLSHEQMKTVLRDLEKTENRFSCPHGRPTQWLLSTREIEKRFKRIS